jgi:hypothetical protein
MNHRWVRKHNIHQEPVSLIGLDEFLVHPKPMHYKVWRSKCMVSSVLFLYLHLHAFNMLIYNSPSRVVIYVHGSLDTIITHSLYVCKSTTTIVNGYLYSCHLPSAWPTTSSIVVRRKHALVYYYILHEIRKRNYSYSFHPWNSRSFRLN